MKLKIILGLLSVVQCRDEYPFPEIVKFGDLIPTPDIHYSPTIVIIGAGPAGIAAASRLLENGFRNVTILEAENRIGGRVCSVPFGEYVVDLGGQWVHGEVDNAAFQLAWSLGLLERSRDAFKFTVKLFGSSGAELSPELSAVIMDYYVNVTAEDSFKNVPHLKTGSLGEYVELKFKEFFKNHREISSELHQPLLNFLNMMHMGLEAGNSWHDISIDDGWTESPGDQMINWKKRAYGTIIDILIKKYPNPQNELPVLANTFLNNKVTKIIYHQRDGSTKIFTSDKRKYVADHVIFTASLGVLKANHCTLFDPPLPDAKVNSINNIDYGHVAKIILYYDNPWWHVEPELFLRGIYWTEADRQQLNNDPLRKWMLGVASISPIEHKEKLLLIWISSDNSLAMEKIPEDLFYNQTKGLLRRFFGRSYNLTEPKRIIRSMWNTNENFLGTYSFKNLHSKTADASTEKLAEPVMMHGKPVLQFAGEATDNHWATVHGAISSGWREADRLIELYSSTKVIPLD